MDCALQGYALLKVSGMEGLRKELGSRFAKAARSVEVEPETAEA